MVLQTLLRLDGFGIEILFNSEKCPFFILPTEMKRNVLFYWIERLKGFIKVYLQCKQSLKYLLEIK